MKRLLFCCIAYFAVSLGQAQDVHFGLKAGLNAALLTVKEQSESEIRPGLHAGVLAHIHLKDHLALQPELLYSGQGGKRIINGQDAKTSLHYLNMPVLLQYMFHNGFRLQAGPQVGVLLSARQDYNNNNTKVIQNFKTIDVSLPVGLSYLTSSGLGIDLRWAFGLTNINDVVNGSGERLPEVRNQVGQVGLFYLLQYDH
jgi:Outer membrane protein beta-barrel domain